MKKNILLLLTSIGIAGIGNWIYFIALNLMVFNQTGSAAAVGLLYIVRPVAALLTSIWCGSLVDRADSKRLIHMLLLFQGLIVTALGFFAGNLWISYVCVFLLQVLSSILHPAIMSFTVQVISDIALHRFNALRSLLDSGAFLIGPAVAGILLMNGTPELAIFLNAGALILASVFITWISVETSPQDFKDTPEPFSIRKSWIRDWKITLQYRRSAPADWLIYFIFTLFIVLQAGVDSLEVAFSKEVIGLSDSQYGVLISMAGAGILIGSFVNLVLASFICERNLMRIGCLLTATGYLIFALSDDFTSAVSGVCLLGFALSFANTGFLTFVQRSLPPASTGRIISYFQLIESLLIIVLTTLLAWLSFHFTLSAIVLTGVLIMSVITVYLALVTLKAPVERNRFAKSFHFTHVKRRILK